ncbi:MAG: helix-turn-helix domain-containing protein [Hyphomicrobiales bacterium]
MSSFPKDFLNALKDALREEGDIGPDRAVLDIEAAAQFLGVSVHGVRHWCRTTDIPYFRLGAGPRARLHFHKSELEKWIASRRRGRA